MTDRIRLDDLTSNDLDRLYDELAQLRDRFTTQAVAGADLAVQLGGAEATIARVQALADRWVKAGPPLGVSMARWWDMRLVELRAALAEPGPATAAAGHAYLSTGCYHGDHTYCQSMTGLNGAKRPASCKFCQASCRCGCHNTTEQPGPA